MAERRCTAANGPSALQKATTRLGGNLKKQDWEEGKNQKLTMKLLGLS
jgi:hypothetical protein